MRYFSNDKNRKYNKKKQNVRHIWLAKQNDNIGSSNRKRKQVNCSKTKSNLNNNWWRPAKTRQWRIKMIWWCSKRDFMIEMIWLLFRTTICCWRRSTIEEHGWSCWLIFNRTWTTYLCRIWTCRLIIRISCDCFRWIMKEFRSLFEKKNNDKEKN